jgi:hypothetical protein
MSVSLPKSQPPTRATGKNPVGIPGTFGPGVPFGLSRATSPALSSLASSSTDLTLSSFPSSTTSTYSVSLYSPLVLSSPSQISSPSDAASTVTSSSDSVQSRMSALHTIIGLSVGGGLSLVLLLVGVVATRMRYQRILEMKRDKVL